MEVGTRVKVISSDKSCYDKTIGRFGTLERCNNKNNYGVKIDDMCNPSSSVGLYWFKEHELDFLEEEFGMAKLRGYKEIAVIQQGYGEYHYAIYEDGNTYGIGDKVTVSNNNDVWTISEVISVDEMENKYNGAITAEVTGLVDTTAYQKRVEKRKKAERIKTEMDRRIKQMSEFDKYEFYAEKDKELAKLLNRFKEVMD